MNTTSSQLTSQLMDAYLNQQMVSIELTNRHISGLVVGIQNAELFIKGPANQITKISFDKNQIR
ncbi:hypothetical protein [Lentilactobacillus kosonis]|uniref:LSM domain-containing protein n=1 Tax=Lentilactobacillus kosonis TaxID=2810561 RepID=A0A401FI89_9LACO|nr:hypothetical protein [Lentilactobacillus kosonis]GAY72100.1 hypothetical protein NBRC111893_246 [Lentilactobacillus kosonis]